MKVKAPELLVKRYKRKSRRRVKLLRKYQYRHPTMILKRIAIVILKVIGASVLTILGTIIVVSILGIISPTISQKLTESNLGVHSVPEVLPPTSYRRGAQHELTNDQLHNYLIHSRATASLGTVGKPFQLLIAMDHRLNGTPRVSYISIPSQNLKIGTTSQTKPDYLINFAIEETISRIPCYLYEVNQPLNGLAKYNPDEKQKSRWGRQWVYIKRGRTVYLYEATQSKRYPIADANVQTMFPAKNTDHAFLIGVNGQSTNKAMVVTMLVLKEALAPGSQSFAIENQF